MCHWAGRAGQADWAGRAGRAGWAGRAGRAGSAAAWLGWLCQIGLVGQLGWGAMLTRLALLAGLVWVGLTNQLLAGWAGAILTELALLLG